MHAISEVDGQPERLGLVGEPVGQAEHGVAAGQAGGQVAAHVELAAVAAAVRRQVTVGAARQGARWSPAVGARQLGRANLVTLALSADRHTSGLMKTDRALTAGIIKTLDNLRSRAELINDQLREKPPSVRYQ